MVGKDDEIVQSDYSYFMYEVKYRGFYVMKTLGMSDKDIESDIRDKMMDSLKESYVPVDNPYNNVPGYTDESGKIPPDIHIEFYMNNEHPMITWIRKRYEDETRTCNKCGKEITHDNSFIQRFCECGGEFLPHAIMKDGLVCSRDLSGD